MNILIMGKDFIMIKYKKELDYFNNLVNLLDKYYDCEHLKKFIDEIIKLDSVEEIANYYHHVKDQLAFAFVGLEHNFDAHGSVDEIKTRTVMCAIERLLFVKQKLQINGFMNI